MAAPEIRTIGVVGLGSMGAGIAQLAVEAGYETIRRDVTHELGAQARGRLPPFFKRKGDREGMSAADRETALDRLPLTTDLADLAGCDLVIEAIIEALDA